jgi:hypothetical protein
MHEEIVKNAIGGEVMCKLGEEEVRDEEVFEFIKARRQHTEALNNGSSRRDFEREYKCTEGEHRES